MKPTDFIRGLFFLAEVERLKIEGEKIKPEEPEEETEPQERQQPGWVTSITGGKWGLQ